LVQAGEVAQAHELLGHPFAFAHVEVVHGDARGGAELGYPTANIDPSRRLIRPALGIYAGRARLHDGSEFAAAISVGKRPQFYDHGDVLVEAYLLDFTGNLYGQPVTIEFLRFLRPELTFASIDELVEQMGRDVAETATIYRTSGAESA
jgi:riboflavin kinase/FMN adenylyltransferase